MRACLVCHLVSQRTSRRAPLPCTPFLGARGAGDVHTGHTGLAGPAELVMWLRIMSHVTTVHATDSLSSSRTTVHRCSSESAAITRRSRLEATQETRFQRLPYITPVAASAATLAAIRSQTCHRTEADAVTACAHVGESLMRAAAAPTDTDALPGAHGHW